MLEKENEKLTRERILDQAERLFSEKGYDAVSVRAVTNAAGCNLSAINYYFGNKQNLYLEVFRSRWIPRAVRIQACFKKALERQPDPHSPRGIIRAMAQAFLEGPLSDEERIRHHQLMAREITKPTEAFEIIGNKVMEPFHKYMANVLRPAMPDDLDQERLMLNLISVFALVLHFNFGRVVVSRITGKAYDEAFKAKVIDHIVEFCLKGIGPAKQEDQN